MIVNANSIVHAVQIKHGIVKYVNVSVKSICANKNYGRNPCKCICENGKYLKKINDNLKIVCDGIKYVVNNVPPNVSKHSDDKKVRHKLDCYIVQIVLLVIILLFIMAIICYHQYEKQRSKLKKKNFMENNGFKKVLCYGTCYYFDDIIKLIILILIF